MTDKPPILPKIGIVSDERYPHHNTTTQQVLKNAAALARVGLDVELVIPSRLGRTNWSRSHQLDELSEYYGIPELGFVRFLTTLPASDVHAPVKLLHGLAAPILLAAHGYQILYTRNLLPTVAFLALGKKVVFETYRALGYEYPTVMRFLARIAANSNLVGLILHSHFSADSLVGVGFPRAKMLVAHNGYDPKDMEPVLTIQEARQQLGLPLVANLAVYTGNMQATKNLSLLIEMAVHIPEVQFLLVGGKAAEIRTLQDFARRVNAHNVRFTGHKPVASVPAYLYAADVLLIPPTKKPLAEHGRTVLPMKTFAYLGAGRAILAPDLPDVKEVLIDGKNAYLVEPDDPTSAAEGLRRLFSDPALRARLSEGAIETATGLSWDARAARIKDWLQVMLEPNEGLMAGFG